MIQLRVERTIAAPAEAVFAWVADPVNLTASPLIFKAGWSKGSPEPGVGALRDALALGMWLREEITAYDPPRSYSYLIVRSFPAMDHDGGTLTLTPSGGGTHVEWVTSLTFPLRGGGKVSEAVTAPLFKSGFEAILAGCAKALES
ncbi:SRPBCC family protein [Mycobacterium sp. NPDC051804]|uniref:SRPBCC family protein n=1 Tax=Mycobacterium sp. NPDC051804 TaxID=3364295 RepID=UPI00379BBBCB